MSTLNIYRATIQGCDYYVTVPKGTAGTELPAVREWVLSKGIGGEDSVIFIGPVAQQL